MRERRDKIDQGEERGERRGRRGQMRGNREERDIGERREDIKQKR